MSKSPISSHHAGQVVLFCFDGHSTALHFLEILEAGGGLTFDHDSVCVISRHPRGLVSFPGFREPTIGDLVGGSAPNRLARRLINPCNSVSDVSPSGQVARAADSCLDGIGLDGRFCRDFHQLLNPDSSAICFLVWGEPPGCGLDISRLSCATVLRAVLSVSDEHELKHWLE